MPHPVPMKILYPSLTLRLALLLHFLLLCSYAQDTGAVAGTIYRQISTEIKTPVNRYSGQNILPKHISEHGKVRNQNQAIVYLIPAEPQPTTPAADRPIIEQKDLQFEPRLLPVQVGTTVDFPNSDPVFHNVFSYSKTKTFDLGRYRKGKSKSVTFDQEGLVKVFCEIHKDMSAYVLVIDTSYFTVSDGEQKYQISNLPPGKYELIAWQEHLPEIRQSIIILPNSTLQVDIR